MTLDHLNLASDVLQFIRVHMAWHWWQSAKPVFLLTSAINQTKFNKSMLHKPPSHLAQKAVLLISKTGTRCVSRVWASLSIKPRKGTSWKVLLSCRKLWAYFEQEKSMSPCLFCKKTFIDFPCSMPALQNLTHQPEAQFTSQGSQDLVKLLPHRGSFTFRPRYQV